MHEFWRERAQAVDDLIPWQRGQDLTVHHAVQSEPGCASFWTVFCHSELAGKMLVSTAGRDGRDDCGSGGMLTNPTSFLLKPARPVPSDPLISDL